MKEEDLAREVANLEAAIKSLDVLPPGGSRYISQEVRLRFRLEKYAFTLSGLASITRMVMELNGRKPDAAWARIESAISERVKKEHKLRTAT